MSSPVIVWIAMLAVFIVIEAATAQLVTIWFAIGALAALATALAHGPIALQVVVFVVVVEVDYLKEILLLFLVLREEKMEWLL